MEKTGRIDAEHLSEEAGLGRSVQGRRGNLQRRRKGRHPNKSR